jgi:hypothetical protein
MELESGQCCGNLRHHVAIASDPSPNIAVAVRLTPTTQKPRLIRRSASSRQSIIHRPLQTMWGVCNAYVAACWDNEDASAAEANRSDQRGAADLAAQGTEGERQVSLSL